MNGNVYILKSRIIDRYYVGSSSDVSRRIKEHNQSSNKWTKQNGPFELIYYESYYCEKDTRHREIFYKSGFDKQIKKIIVDFISGSGSVG